MHTLNKPPFMLTDIKGDKRWYNADNHLHNDGDLPAVICADGSMGWFKDGLNHRENDLPSAITPAVQWWTVNGRFHRENGPAIVWANGEVSHWSNGKKVG